MRGVVEDVRGRLVDGQGAGAGGGVGTLPGVVMSFLEVPAVVHVVLLGSRRRRGRAGKGGAPRAAGTSGPCAAPARARRRGGVLAVLGRPTAPDAGRCDGARAATAEQGSADRGTS